MGNVLASSPVVARDSQARPNRNDPELGLNGPNNGSNTNAQIQTQRENAQLVPQSFIDEARSLYFGPHFVLGGPDTVLSEALQSELADAVGATSGSNANGETSAGIQLNPMNFGYLAAKDRNTPLTSYTAKCLRSLVNVKRNSLKLKHSLMMPNHEHYNDTTHDAIYAQSPVSPVSAGVSSPTSPTPLLSPANASAIPSSPTSPTSSVSPVPSRYTLSFQFDTLAPCLVHVYLLSTETLTSQPTPKTTQTQSTRLPTKHFLEHHCVRKELPESQYHWTFGPFPKGLNQTVTTDVLFDSTKFSFNALIIDTEKLLNGNVPTKPTVWPLLIVLDASSSTSEISKDTIPIQTTYCTFHLTKDGTYDIKVVKQRGHNLDLGVHYLLQEIYGLSRESNSSNASPAAEPSSSISKDTNKDCVICLSSPRSVLLLPCRHLCLCGQCSDVFRWQGTRNQMRYNGQGPRPERAKCPICRTTVTGCVSVSVQAVDNDAVNVAAEGIPSAPPLPTRDDVSEHVELTTVRENAAVSSSQ